MTQPAGRPLSAEFAHKPGTPGGPPGKPGDKPGGLAAAWKKNPAMVIGGVGVGGVILFALSRKNAAASTNNGYSDTATNPGAALPTYDSSASDMYNNLETQLGNLQDQIAGLGSTPVTTPVTTPTTPSSGSTNGLPGPIHGERTRAGAETLPELAHLFGVTPQTLVSYNPGWSLSQTKTFDPHNIGTGVFFRVPSTARQKTLHPASK